MNTMIKFKHCDFKRLSGKMMQDLSKESFAILLGKQEIVNNHKIINVFEINFMSENDYNSQSQAYLSLNKNFFHNVLKSVTKRVDVDSIIDVHTHPFSVKNVSFSSVDDRDEKKFYKFILDNFDNLNYAGIVLAQKSYSARLWYLSKTNKIQYTNALIKTQTTMELGEYKNCNNKFNNNYLSDNDDSMFNRSVKALGLDVMRRIVHNQNISIVGVGGIGSIIAEHLIHMGFNKISLFDNDNLEISNLNRFVGGYYDDAVKNLSKVEVVKRHLKKINPESNISTFNLDITKNGCNEHIAFSDWIFIATDNHTSRFKIQQIAFKYFIPFIAVGVNISVEENQILDCSGEVITVKMGDKVCLNCLNRINYIAMAEESHPSKEIKSQLLSRGYVKGAKIKEPAVKTLNSMLATMSVNALINNYMDNKFQPPVLVYENNNYECIYEDKESVINRNKRCYTCDI